MIWQSIMLRRFAIAVLVSVIALCAWPGAGRAADSVPDSLVKLVRGFYGPYLIKNPDYEPPSDTDVIAAHATAHLKMLISRYYACENKTQDDCGLDFDVIINGQDWDLKAPPEVSAQQDKANEYIVSSRFESAGTANDVNFIFVNQDGQWLIDDVTQTDPSTETWRLTDMISAVQ
jgi:hypothetical protein